MLVAGAFAAVCAGTARAQISPGPLAAAHRELEGPLQCFQCHGPRGGGVKAGMDRRCLDCHREIDWMRAQKRGFHARVGDRACASCHPDHGGADFKLVVWDEGSPARFDHRRTGYVLEGRHAELECAKCHQPRFQRSGAAAAIRVRDRSRSWLGLERECAACHADPHRAQLGADCARCHDMRGWKPAPGFDHARARYPLTGAHAKVACESCHLRPRLELARDAAGRRVPQYRPLAFGACTDCHRDPHAARFGAACAKCHVTESWRSISRSGFDHDLTRYPLRGRHSEVACASCHDAKRAWGAKPAFAACTSCHRDAHAGTATLAGRAVDCAACHSVSGYRPSTYTAAAHQASAYPLEGAHARAACAGCHPKAAGAAAVAKLGEARVDLRPRHDRCVDCHRDPHEGRLPTAITVAAAAPAPNGRGRRNPAPARVADAGEGCRGCHTMESFRPSRVDVAAHARYRFALEGAHRAVPCQKCHAELDAAPAATSLLGGATRSGAGARRLRFEERARACADCHADPHGGQFAARRDRGACDGCHGLEAWIPASRFDHDRDAAFRLEGAHARTACASCHRPSKGATRIVYRPLSGSCESCHGGTPRDRRSAIPAPPRPLAMMEVTHAS